jgi:hypothetical protein
MMNMVMEPKPRGVVYLEGANANTRRILATLANLEGETLTQILIAWDEKGTLNVKWREQPSIRQMVDIEQAWEQFHETKLRYWFATPGLEGISVDVLTGTTIRSEPVPIPERS